MDINDCLFHFIPKSSNNSGDESCGNIVFRHPSELRPLTLKNADDKVVAGCANWCLSPVIEKTASQLQRGFIHGRQLLQNIVDLDFSARERSLIASGAEPRLPFSCDLGLSRRGIVGILPILLLFDFAAAFPSVSHKWLRAVLLAIKIPRGILNLFDCLYDSNEAFCSVGGRPVAWIFNILCGVLQGCPFSGSLFVILNSH